MEEFKIAIQAMVLRAVEAAGYKDLETEEIDLNRVQEEMNPIVLNPEEIDLFLSLPLPDLDK
jgi:hypothetical protein